MTNPDGFPTDPAEQPPVAAAAGLGPSLNPFAGNQPVEQLPSRLGLGGNILSQAGVLIPPATVEARQTGEVMSDVQDAAKKTCGLIADMFIEEGDPDSISFPVCSDMRVIEESLKQLTNTPLGLGFGPFPETVPRAWSRFMRETTEHHRSENGLEVADLVPLKIEMPNWINENPTFDILVGCSLMDIEIVGKVNSAVAREAKNCRIRFKNDVQRDAVIGNKASRCTFIFEGNMYASESLSNAKNISVHIAGSHSGNMGTMTTSKVTCDGQWGGYFFYKGQGCTKGQGVEWYERN